MYDSRNPYGRRGGYTDRFPYDMTGSDYDMRRNEYDMRHNEYDMRRNDYARRDYPDYADYADYHKKGRMLDDRTVDMWGRALLNDIDPKDQQKFKMDQILKRAEEMGIRFDKVTPQEFYTTVLMMVTDYHKTLGMMNVDIFIKLAKDWLCDPDSPLKYGEKLAAYYNEIINV